MKSSQVRSTFLSYFEEKGHRLVSSSPLIPYHDPTLLFCNAGMNQFKDTFLGREKRPYRRAATSQKCMRVSGKHNDFEDVGRSFRHHTFFEMLGNFSFGDYFKLDAIRFAWELITERFGLPKDRLFVTVFEKDDEAFDLWARETDVARERIFRFGEKDNFWAMGDTGPCGPCSEIHYDYGTSPLGHTDCDLSCSCGRYVELWNLVFMQFDRNEQGQMSPLPSPSIDTGMGLERITTVLQGKVSNYDTDLFMPLIEFVCRLSSQEYLGGNSAKDTAMRIIADHARAAAFMVADGQYPGNDKRGYVLRKIIRRAIVHGRKLGLHDPFLHQVALQVAERMGGAYPELLAHQETISRAVRAEEEIFSHTLSSGLREFQSRADQLRKGQSDLFPGTEAFFLYDTHGLPLETIKELCAETGMTVDESEFHSRMEQQRDLSRQGQEAMASPAEVQNLSHHESAYAGHESMRVEDARILALYLDNQAVPSLEAGVEGFVFLDRTPFYAESGGQSGDQGVIGSDAGKAKVLDCRHFGEKAIGHRVRVEQGSLQTGDQVYARVDAGLRLATRRNHTATHLLHASLRQVLGEHVKQAGSLVSSSRLRFDFSHYAAVSPGELSAIEDLANRIILENRPVSRTLMKREEALASGSMALFGEKYQEVVSVISIPGFSSELCGGTHVSHTGEVGLLKVLSESSISAGIRRVEASTGVHSLDHFRQSEQILENISTSLKCGRDEIGLSLERHFLTVRELSRKVEELQLKMGQAAAGNILEKVVDIRGVSVLAQRVDGMPKDGLRELADRLCRKLSDGIVILGSEVEGKSNMVVLLSGEKAQKVHAGKLVKEIAPIISGGGGGKANMAEAGGKSAEFLDKAIEKGLELVKKHLGD